MKHLARLLAAVLLVTTARASYLNGFAQGSTTSGQSGQLQQGAATTNSPAYTTGQTDPLSLDLLGNLRVIHPDQLITGQGSQLASGQNIILATAGTGASNVAGYRSWCIEIVPASGTVTAGNITFYGSNDNVNFQAIYVYDQNAPGGAPVSTYALAATTNRFFKGPIQWQYVKAQITTAITGTTTGVQAFTSFSQATFIPDNFLTITGGTTSPSVSIATGGNVIGGVTGNVAVGSAPSGSPLADSGSTLSTLPSAAIANGLTERLALTGDQQLIVHQDGDPSNEWMATSGTTALATTTSTALKAAGATGVRNYCTGLQLFNSSTTVATTVTILDGSTVIWTGYLPEATATSLTPTVVEFRTPLKGTAATAMNIQLGTTGASVYYNVQGFQNN